MTFAFNFFERALGYTHNRRRGVYGIGVRHGGDS